MSLCWKERQADFSTASTKDTYLPLIPNLFLIPEITAVFPHMLLYTSSMLKWKPTAPDYVLASTEAAPMWSEIICTLGFLSSSHYLFAHQHCPCLPCRNLTDAQTSSKKGPEYLFRISLLLWCYIIWLVCLPVCSKRREGRLNALANPKVLSSFSL